MGKTLVACGLVAALKERGIDVGVMKPLESGAPCFESAPMPQDALTLKEIAGINDDLDQINPYCFSNPVAPGIAAEQAGIEIDLQRIKGIYEELKATPPIHGGRGGRGAAWCPLPRGSCCRS